MPEATLKQIREFFGMTTAQFRAEWVRKEEDGGLTALDREQIKQGIGDGSLTY